MKRYSKRPLFIRKAVLWVSYLAIGSYWYVHAKSILENIVAQPNKLSTFAI